MIAAPQSQTTAGKAQTTALVSVENLRITFGEAVAVDGLSFELNRGESLALVGESGSGKSVTARSLIGLAGAGAQVEAQRLEVNGESVLTMRSRQLRAVRGRQIGLVLQDALVSLDPLRPIGREIEDSLRLHTPLSWAARKTRVHELLEAVHMPEPELRMRQRSGELSGGLRQRALIASAIAADPSLLIADEPTTALDVTVQAQILDLLAELTNNGMALLLISHDLAVVRNVADRVAVMRHGRIVEQGDTEKVLGDPQHPYTRALIAAVPSGRRRGERLIAEPLVVTDRPATFIPSATPSAEVLLEANGLVKEFSLQRGTRHRAVDNVSLQLNTGQTLGLVGESGSGKSTIARLMLGLTKPDAGRVSLLGEPWAPLPERLRRERRHTLGAIYQDPLSSFDPRFTVAEVLTEAVSGGATTRSSSSRNSSPRGTILRGASHQARISELMDAVGLPDSIRGRRPLHLSGGQRQRVAIARALAPNPRILICDEPVSALDVSIQAQVLDLLTGLQHELGLSYLFISHDLGVVQHMSDTVAVMRAGRIVETGAAGEVFAAPSHDYTRQLIDAAPRL